MATMPHIRPRALLANWIALLVGAFIVTASLATACEDNDAGLVAAFGDDGPAGCAEVAGFCDDPTFGEDAKKFCPKTCGACPAAAASEEAAPSSGACDDNDAGLVAAFGDDGPAGCAEVAGFCDDPTFGEHAKKFCPETCGVCPSGSAAAAAEETAASSGACADKDDAAVKAELGMPSCAAVESFCDDQTNGENVRRVCPKTCGRCPDPSAPACRDDDGSLKMAGLTQYTCETAQVFCAGFNGAGKLSSRETQELVHTHCKETCGMCGHAATGSAAPEAPGSASSASPPGGGDSGRTSDSPRLSLLAPGAAALVACAARVA